MKTVQDPIFGEMCEIELTQTFGQTKPSNVCEILSLDEATQRLIDGEIEGFELAMDDTFHPMSIIARFRKFADRCYQIRHLSLGREGSGIYGDADELIYQFESIVTKPGNFEFYCRSI